METIFTGSESNEGDGTNSRLKIASDGGDILKFQVPILAESVS